jgi:hypothetical protein
MKIGLLLGAALVVLGTSPLASLPLSPDADEAFSYTGGADWEKGIVYAVAKLDAAKAGLVMPGGRARAEQIVAARMQSAARDVLSVIPLDSADTIGSAVVSGRIRLESMTDFVSGTPASSSRFSPDLSSFIVEYRFPTRSIGALFATDAAPEPAPLYLDYRPTRKYSGILIYATDPLPVYGEPGKTSNLTPCLLPRIRDTTMALIHERSMEDQGVFRSDGVVIYAAKGDSPAVVKRVGTDPLRILAVGVYGRNRTDPIIDRDDALKILSNADDRDLLVQGRIAIVCPITAPQPAGR